ncbi:MAG TPA: hypothetical protein VKP30_26870, partial [Polyangiaceae bacterium]|nr:hypothetical protein [Polyangiaceae bacterium]
DWDIIHACARHSFERGRAVVPSVCFCLYSGMWFNRRWCTISNTWGLTGLDCNSSRCRRGRFGPKRCYGSNRFGIGQGTISNTIVWGSTIADVAIIDETAPTKFSYSCIETGAYTDSIDLEGGGKSTPLQGVSLTRKGAGCQDPLFVNAAELDFHLRSLGGHLDSATHTWVNDTETSPCIDAGDPASDCALESAPNGGRVNLGAYGGTAEASHSP